jgi:hypothetical protein
MESFSKILVEQENGEMAGDVRRRTKVIARAIHGLAVRIYETYPVELLNESPEFIVSAVWGVAAAGQLTPLQKEISKKIPPLVQEVLDILELDDSSEEQQFAIGYLVRGIIIAQISFTVQMLRTDVSVESRTREAAHNLADLQPLGSA